MHTGNGYSGSCMLLEPKEAYISSDCWILETVASQVNSSERCTFHSPSNSLCLRLGLFLSFDVWKSWQNIREFFNEQKWHISLHLSGGYLREPSIRPPSFTTTWQSVINTENS